ncbi:MAG: beta-propeller fold lactonase family protein [Candidatus Marinimicrobia bacterium]|nr:beta-propeller fold lactonase family protein [Candidatus Neomarinimicrobiota bacterium]
MKRLPTLWFLVLVALLFATLPDSLLQAAQNEVSPGDMFEFNREEVTNDQVLEQLQGTDKLGFLYFTAEWCGPCKMLQREVFVKEDVIQLMEENFISFWLDEANPYVRNLMKIYEARAFPTMVIIDSKGNLVDKIVGSRGMDQFIAEVRKSIEGGETLYALRQKYQANPDNIGIALKYADALVDVYSADEAIPIYENFKDQVKSDSLKEEVWFNLSKAYQHNRQSEKATEVLKSGLDNNLFQKKKYYVLSQLGQTSFRNRQYNQTIEYISQIPIRELNIEDRRQKFSIERTFYSLPISYLKLDQKDKAEDSFKKVGSYFIENKNPHTIASAAQLCLIHETGEEGYRAILPWLEKAETIELGKNAYYYDSYATMTALTGNPQNAISLYEKLIEVAPEQSPPGMPEYAKRHIYEAKAKIAVLYSKLNNEEQSKEYLKDVKENSPDNFNVEQEIAQASALFDIPVQKVIGWESETPAERGENKVYYTTSLTDRDLSSVTSTEVHKSGEYVYATAYRGSNIIVYSRDKKTGKLQKQNQIHDPDLLNGVVSMRLCGGSKYAAAMSFLAKTVTLYKCGDDGNLELLDYARNGQDGVEGMTWPVDGVFSPDNKFLFVVNSKTSGNNPVSGISVLKITSDNRLEFVENSLGEDASFDGARGIALHPEKKVLYIAANKSHKLAAATWDDATGKLSVKQVISDGAGKANGLEGIMGVALSPDKKHLYVTSGRFGGDHGVTVFNVEKDGSLSFQQEIINEDLAGFEGGNEIVVSSDGKSVMTVGTLSNSIANFERNSRTGELNLVEIIEKGASMPAGLALSPDDNHLYVADENISTISVYQVE